MVKLSDKQKQKVMKHQQKYGVSHGRSMRIYMINGDTFAVAHKKALANADKRKARAEAKKSAKVEAEMRKNKVDETPVVETSAENVEIVADEE